LKKAATSLLSAIIALASLGVWTAPVQAADTPISLIVDRRTITLDVAPIIENDRVLLPYRAIGEALGATVSWNESSRLVGLTLGDTVLELTIGSAILNITKGSVKRTETLDAPAKILDGRTLVPVRAISEGLGALVTWDDLTRTVNVTSPLPPVPTAVPTPTPPALNVVFTTDPNFEIIAGSRAQFMYDNNNSVLLYYFDSRDAESIARLPAIKAAAKTEGATVYGIDVRTSDKLDKLTWLWNYVDRSSTQYPVLLVMYNSGNIQKITTFGSQQELDDIIYNWSKGFYSTTTPTPTPAPVTGTPTPTPTPTGMDMLSRYFRHRSEYEATRLYNNNETFIYVYFDSSKPGYETNLEIIKQAVVRLEEDVFYSDHKDEAEKDEWWFANDLYTASPIPNPCVFLVQGGGLDTKYGSDIVSAEYMVNIFRNFLETYR
jgi:hypothetical protein